MGQIHLLTKEQEIILDQVKQNDFLRSNFYFTGGTALSSNYLCHRYSEDLDFFSEKKFDQQVILTIVQNWAKKYDFSINSEFIEVVYKFFLTFPNKTTLKVDFAFYPYQRIETPNNLSGTVVDSLVDIAINKLMVISQRTDVKDFVDLYYLLETFSLWDLLGGVKQKFKMDIEPFILASDFLKVEDFENLPRMIKPLTLDELKIFFRAKAKELGMQSVQ